MPIASLSCSRSFRSSGLLSASPCAAIVPLLVLLWWIDPLRVRLRTAMAGMTVCFAALLALAFTVQLEPFEAFYGHNHVSNFTRSGISVVSDLMKHGFLESDPVVADRLKSRRDTTCQPAGKPPHIIMVHDESSFDIRSAARHPGAARLRRAFQVVRRQGAAICSWKASAAPAGIAEYNVLTGLSARSFGRFSYFVTRIASGRVDARSAECVAPLRLPDLLALSLARRFHERAQLPDDDRHAAVQGCHRHGCQGAAAGRILL